MATQTLLVLQTLRLLRRAALAIFVPVLCAGATCDFPSTPITNANPVYTYNINYSPVVAGTVKVEYFTQLVCAPYVTYTWDSLKGPYTLSVLQGSPVYARITITSAPSVDPQVPQSIVIYYFNPPEAPKAIVPAAPTGFKVT